MTKSKAVVGPILIALLMGGAILLVFREQAPWALWQALLQIKLRYVFLGLLFMFFFVGCEAFGSFLILRVLGNVCRYVRCLSYSFTGFYFSSITPSSSGGQPAQVYHMRSDGIPVVHGSMTLCLLACAYQCAALLYAGFALLMYPIYFLQLGAPLQALFAVGVFVSVTLASLMLLLLFFPRRMRRFVLRVFYFAVRSKRLAWLKKRRGKVRRFLADYQKGSVCLRKNPRLFPVLLATSLLQLTFLYLVPYLVYRGFGLRFYGALDLICVQAILNLSMSFIPLPGAAGATEGAFLRAFTIFFGRGLVAPAMLLCRGISFYAFLLLSGGLVSFFFWRVRRRGVPG